MEASNLKIYWHELKPVYSLAFQPSQAGLDSNISRLVTAGGDNQIRVWQLNFKKDERSNIDTIDFMSSLVQHEKAVNVVRFNSCGDTLATAGDDGMIVLWKKNDEIIKRFGVEEEEFAEFKESWRVTDKLSITSSTGISEIYDLAWSPCGRYIVTGSMDNTLRVFDIEEKICCAQVSDHSHYIQGVVWDPQDEYLISQSADRSVNLYTIVREGEDRRIRKLKLHHRLVRGDIPSYSKDSNFRRLDYANTKSFYLFHNETLPSFFRRPAISPCGSILCVPAGIFKTSRDTLNNEATNFGNSVYIYTRSSIKHKSSTPILSLPYLKTPALAVKFSPVFYELDGPAWLKLPYKLVFAVATLSEVLIYDSVNLRPLAIIENLHYSPLTDLSWSENGNLLLISSTDGFCSYVSINDDILGIHYKELSVQKTSEQKSSTMVSEKNSVSFDTHKEKLAKQEQLITVVAEPVEAYSNTGYDAKQKRRVQPTLVQTNKTSILNIS